MAWHMTTVVPVILIHAHTIYDS